MSPWSWNLDGLYRLTLILTILYSLEKGLLSGCREHFFGHRQAVSKKTISGILMHSFLEKNSVNERAPFPRVYASLPREQQTITSQLIRILWIAQNHLSLKKTAEGGRNSETIIVSDFKKVKLFYFFRSALNVFKFPSCKHISFFLLHWTGRWKNMGNLCKSLYTKIFFFLQGTLLLVTRLSWSWFLHFPNPAS